MILPGNVAPEEWLLVLAKLHRAVRRGGLLYMTVDETEQSYVDTAFAALTDAGMLAVHSEVTEGDKTAVATVISGA
jgi:hypothetical protein